MKHTLIVVNPGHFHAALTLRERHPLLSDEVHVYAEDGPDLDNFLRIVASFNERAQNPTSWAMRVYRGADFLEALLRERPGDVAILAGKNSTKLPMMYQLHESGIHVLGDKTWIVDAQGLDLLAPLTASAPLTMDIMTERFEIATRLQQALSCDQDVFGGFRDTGGEPAVYFKSVHHLYKEVNAAPLVRPPWYFDTSVQGEGITDVATHLVDLAQWMICRDQGVDYARDLVLTAARQWPTDIPVAVFSRITGNDAFPAQTRGDVRDGVLAYLCNAKINYTLRDVPVELDVIWDLAIPAGGGDTHYGVLRGKRADLIVDQGAQTGFETRLRILPVTTGPEFEQALQHALHGLRDAFPGTGYRACDISPVDSDPVQITSSGPGFEITIPVAMHQGHEARFAEVLDQFLGYVNAGRWPQRVGEELVAKYTLLANAYELSHR